MMIDCMPGYRVGEGEINADFVDFRGKNRFLRFFKNGQFSEMRNSGGKTIKTPKNIEIHRIGYVS